MRGLWSLGERAGVPQRVLRLVGTPLGPSQTVNASVVGTTETALVSWTIPAHELAAGATYYLECYGRASRTATTPTVTLRYRLTDAAGALLAATPAIGGPVGSITDRGWSGIAVLKVLTTGSAGTIALSADQELQIDQTNGFDIQTLPSVNTEADLTVCLTVQFGANTAGNRFDVDIAHTQRIT